MNGYGTGTVIDKSQLQRGLLGGGIHALRMPCPALPCPPPSLPSPLPLFSLPTTNPSLAPHRSTPHPTTPTRPPSPTQACRPQQDKTLSTWQRWVHPRAAVLVVVMMRRCDTRSSRAEAACPVLSCISSTPPDPSSASTGLATPAKPQPPSPRQQTTTRSDHDYQHSTHTARRAGREIR